MLLVLLENGFISCVAVIVVSVISSGTFIYTLGLNSTERAVAIKAVRNKIKQYGIGK